MLNCVFQHTGLTLGAAAATANPASSSGDTMARQLHAVGHCQCQCRQMGVFVLTLLTASLHVSQRLICCVTSAPSLPVSVSFAVVAWFRSVLTGSTCHCHFAPAMSVRLETTHGPITIKLHCKETPRTCRNFIELAKHGYYDGIIFHVRIRDAEMR